MAATTQADRSTVAGQPHTKSAFYRPELDGLRFFAFLSVLIGHTAIRTPDYFSQHHVAGWLQNVIIKVTMTGFRGVDLFFALSAYLITELLLREKDELGFLHIRSFYIRRILRIWPLYFFFLFSASIFSWLTGAKLLTLGHFLAFVFMAGNWGIILFGSMSPAITLLWTVSIEEQFYMLWPPVVARLTRRQIIYAAVILVAVAYLSRITLDLVHCTPPQMYFSTFVRLDSIAGGILLAAGLHGRLPQLSTPSRFICIAVAVLGIWFSARYYGDPTSTLRYEMLVTYPVSAIACTGIVYCVLGMKFKSRWLRYLGKISYGLYIYHLACLAFIDRYFDFRPHALHAILRLPLTLGLTVIVASISYAVLEKPFLDLKRRFTFVNSRPA